MSSVWMSSRVCFNPRQQVCSWEKSRHFHYRGIQAKILLSPWISGWDLWSVAQNTREFLHRVYPPACSRPKPINPSAETEFCCPSNVCWKGKRWISTNIYDNRWLREAKRHKRASSPRTSSRPVPRIHHRRRLKVSYRLLLKGKRSATVFFLCLCVYVHVLSVSRIPHEPLNGILMKLSKWNYWINIYKSLSFEVN